MLVMRSGAGACPFTQPAFGRYTATKGNQLLIELAFKM